MRPTTGIQQMLRGFVKAADIFLLDHGRLHVSFEDHGEAVKTKYTLELLVSDYLSAADDEQQWLELKRSLERCLATTTQFYNRKMAE